jgi:hypothetical protein
VLQVSPALPLDLCVSSEQRSARKIEVTPRQRSMSRVADVMLLLLVALHALLPTIVTDAALQEGFYTSSTNCTVDVEATVVSVVQQFISADRGVGAGLIRLHFHDCFVKVYYVPEHDLRTIFSIEDKTIKSKCMILYVPGLRWFGSP